MTQNQLDRLVADATGEDLREIRRHGFGIVNPDLDVVDPVSRFAPQIVDWDDLDRARNVPFFQQPERRRRLH